MVTILVTGTYKIILQRPDGEQDMEDDEGDDYISTDVIPYIDEGEPICPPAPTPTDKNWPK